MISLGVLWVMRGEWLDLAPWRGKWLCSIHSSSLPHNQLFLLLTVLLLLRLSLLNHALDGIAVILGTTMSCHQGCASQFPKSTARLRIDKAENALYLSVESLKPPWRPARTNIGEKLACDVSAR